jgi:signal transduction histidine kinase
LSAVNDDQKEKINTAVNACSQLWLVGCWSRTALLAGMAVTLAWAPADELPRAFAQLLLAIVGLLLAFARLTPGGLDVIGRVPGTTPLVHHLSRTFWRPAVDLPGLAEGGGAFLAASLYAGWFPLAGLPAVVRSLGLAMAVCYGWEIVLQAVIDPSWYNLNPRPSRALRVFRYTIPVLFAGFATLVLLPWHAADAQIPLVVRILLSVSPLIYYPIWGAFAIMLTASATSLRDSRDLWRWDVWSDAHRSVKNTLMFLNQYVEEPEPDLDEIRSRTRHALVVVDEFKSYLVGGRAHDTAGGSVSELWESVLNAMGRPYRENCRLDTEPALLRLPATDYQVARRVLPDLVSNAVKARASKVTASCSISGQPAVVRVVVADDGVGMTADDIGDPRTSLRMLRASLRQRNGDIEHSANADGGTTAVAYWRASPGHGVADA